MPNYIPATVVKVLKDVPLDSSYSDTVLFSSEGAQTSFFEGKVKYTFNQFTYQRVNSSVASPRIPFSVRVPRIADDLYDCNYIMFQNSNFGNKWFYAFIKQVNYINPNNTEIIYEIDSFQTWWYSCSFLPCFVEREHIENDVAFVNTVPEPTEIDYYRVNPSQFWSDYFTGSYIVVVCAYFDGIEAEFTTPGVYGGIFSGGCVYYTEASNVERLIEILKLIDLKGKGSNIISIYTSTIAPALTSGANVQKVTTAIKKETTNILGYAFKNKKLLCYPYRVFKLRTTTGEEIELRPELVNDNNLVVNLHFCESTAPRVVCVPSYDGLITNWDKSLEFNEVVQCGWSSNVFANWMAQNMGSYAISNLSATLNSLTNVATSAISLGVGGARGGIVAGSTASSAISSATSQANNQLSWLDEGIKQYMKGSVPVGKIISGSANYTIGRTGFECVEYCVNEKCAERIDQFFDMYGYATNQIKIPNLLSRPIYNYVKTQNACIKGSAPVQSMDIIKSIFNNGVRLWHGDFVGNYSLNNRGGE